MASAPEESAQPQVPAAFSPFDGPRAWTRDSLAADGEAFFYDLKPETRTRLPSPWPASRPAVSTSGPWRPRISACRPSPPDVPALRQRLDDGGGFIVLRGLDVGAMDAPGRHRLLGNRQLPGPGNPPESDRGAPGHGLGQGGRALGSVPHRRHQRPLPHPFGQRLPGAPGARLCGSLLLSAGPGGRRQPADFRPTPSTTRSWPPTPAGCRVSTRPSTTTCRPTSAGPTDRRQRSGPSSRSAAATWSCTTCASTSTRAWYAPAAR